uniref:Glyco_tran_10_N domain-containing protein n=1 Tax=Caenorhabditis tropicalis TaxID=1561998 RepID=A0A1I7TPC3_9PELO
MWSPSTQRLIILIVVIFVVIRIFFIRSDSIESRDLEKSVLFDLIVETNSLWADDGDEKRYDLYTNIPAYAQVSNKLAAISKSKTAICETDPFIGQQVLCSLQEKLDDEAACDSDSLQYFSDFDDLKREKDLDGNFSEWKILFARRDPIERFVDHYMDTCVREDRACFECRLDLRCYLNNVYSQIVQDYSKNKTVDEDHLKFVPQNYFCQMESMNQRFQFVDYSLFANPTNPAYAEVKRPDVEELFIDSISSYEKISKFYTAFIYSRPDVLDLFIKTYYWDYMIMKMPLPELKLAEVRDYKEGWY